MFAHRLALALHKSVEEVMQLSIQEVRDWEAFTMTHPFPADLIDVHMAIQSCIIANSNRDPKKGHAYEVNEFMLIGEKKQKPEVDEAGRIAAMFAGFE